METAVVNRTGSTVTSKPDRGLAGWLAATCLTLLMSAPAMPVQAQTHAVIVSGLGGEAQYSQAFEVAAQDFAQGLRTLDDPSQRIVLLDESADRQRILAAIDERARAMQSEQASSFVLILVGHGTAAGGSWQFNVRGPDLTTEDLVASLNTLPASEQLVVLASSASGAALDILSQPGRVVMTATKSGGEINAVRFPGFLAEAMSGSAADYDRNEILTAAEAFRFAQARTESYYEDQALLASEHARLRGDNADEIAVALLGSLREARNDPQIASLLTRRLTLEASFRELKSRKSDMPLADYYAELEILLIDIARLQQSIDAQTGWSEGDAES